MTYYDLIKTIKFHEGTYIEFIMNYNINNDWFLMLIKEDLLKNGYKIITTVNISSFDELKHFTKDIDEKTVIFININIREDFSDQVTENNENCTIIFLREQIESVNYYIHNSKRLGYLSSLIISVISNQLKIKKSRYGTTNEQCFDTSTIIRKIKLKDIRYKIENNII